MFVKNNIKMKYFVNCYSYCLIEEEKLLVSFNVNINENYHEDIITSI